MVAYQRWVAVKLRETTNLEKVDVDNCKLNRSFFFLLKPQNDINNDSNTVINTSFK